MSKFSDLGNALYSGDRSIDFVGRRKLWYTVAAIVVGLAVLIPTLRGGFQFGIEFRGGSEFRVTAVSKQGTDIALRAVQKVVPNAEPIITIVGSDANGNNDIRIQTLRLDSTKAEQIHQNLDAGYKVPYSAVSSSFIGASWGGDVTSKALSGLLWFVLLAAIMLAAYFRTVKMSAAAIAALIHDIVVTAGIYGAFGFEVTPAAVIGFLTILGYSLYDTVVVFDKIRENTFEVEFSETATFAERVNLAINQTLVRSINTSVVAVLPVASILFIGALFLGAGTLKDISLALFIGIIVGTYSTIFIAAPLYSQLREGEPKYRKAADRVLASR